MAFIYKCSIFYVLLWIMSNGQAAVCRQTGGCADCSSVNITGTLDSHKLREALGDWTRDATCLDLSRNAITSITSDAFSSLPRLRTLSLSHNLINLSLMDESPFKPLANLRQLDIGDNAMTGNNSLEVFHGLENLSTLIIDGSAPATLPHRLSQLSSLTDLTVKGSIVVLSNSTFRELKDVRLERLSVKARCLQGVEAAAFRWLSHLKHLELMDLPFLQLSSLSSPWTSLGSSLVSLSLWRVGGLTRTSMEPVGVEERFFRSLANTSLSRLAMDDNYITFIQLDNVWKYLANLEYFSLAYNSLVQLSPLVDSLHNLTKLRYFDVSHQYRTAFVQGPDFQVNECHQLLKNVSLSEDGVRRRETKQPEHIYLGADSNNCLHIQLPPALEVYNSSFALFQTSSYELHVHRAYGLRLFNMAGNQIKGLGAKLVFVDKPNHNIAIDYSHNEINDISDGYFDLNSTVNYIENLNLHANHLGEKLADEGCECISKMKNLKYIDLSDNRIKVLPEHTFKDLKLLETINLADNSIRAFQLSMKDTNVTYLDLSNNLLHQFETKEMDDIDSAVKERQLTINLLGNPLLCDDHTLEFLRWVKGHSTKDRLVFKHLSNYTCMYGGQTRHWQNIDGIISDIQTDSNRALYVKVGSTLVAFVVFVVAFSVFIYRHKWDIKFWLIGRVIDKKLKKAEHEEKKRFYRFDAFVSYHQKDFEWVNRVLTPMLEGCRAEPVRLCIHQRDFEVGAPIEENIVKAIRGSRKTLLVVSRRFLTSHWCHFETQMARMVSLELRRDVILPILIDSESDILNDANLSRTLHNILRRRTYLQWPTDPRDEAARNLFARSLVKAFKCASVKRLRCECGRSICPSSANSFLS